MWIDVTDEIDIYRTAKPLIDQHSDDSPIFAAMQADKRAQVGDVEGLRSSTGGPVGAFAY